MDDSQDLTLNLDLCTDHDGGAENDLSIREGDFESDDGQPPNKKKK
jgi:hypothetical protein